MSNIYTLLSLIAGLIAGGVMLWFFFRERIAILRERLENYEVMNKELAIDFSNEKDKRIKLETELDNERRATEEKLALIEKAEENLKNTFKALSSDALKSNNEQFIALAKTELEKLKTESVGVLEQRKQAVENLVKPIAESIEKYDKHVHEMGNKQSEAYGSLTEQIRSIMEGPESLRGITVRLADALSKPHIRGYWGEVQLRRIVEYAGMLEYCDFVSQESVRTEDGLLRPDMIIKIPGGLNIVVDAKTPMDSYMKAVNATDESERKSFLEAHARTVKDHIKKLSNKEYWKQFDPSPDFVVMFIPGEPFYLAVLQQDPSLLSEGVKNRVILASPTTLLALLRVTAFGWRQEQLAENARKISDLGKELYTRIAGLAEHFDMLGKHIANSVSSYNKAIGTLESRVLVSARRFNALGVDSHKKIEEIEPLDIQTRELQAQEKRDE